MTLESVSYQIEVAPERVVRGTIVCPPPELCPAPVVVFCHGFKGHKDWGGWPWWSERLAERGFATHRIDFSLNGVGPSGAHDDLEKFSRNTYGAEMEDLRAVLDGRDQWRLPDGVASEQIALVGHSRGGLVSLLYAATDSRVAAVVTLGAPGNSDRFGPEQKDEWRRQGVLEIENARTGQKLPLDVSVLDDFERRRAEYDVPAAVARRPVPTLVIHGQEDETVPVAEAHQIHDHVADSRKRIVILSGTGHTFDTVHPFTGPTPALETTVSETSAWLEEQLTS